MKDPPTKQTNEINNPCLKEQKQVYKCLHDNNFDRDTCNLHFINYNNCKEFWNMVYRDRRARGETPYLPLPQDRPTVKDEYLKRKPS